MSLSGPAAMTAIEEALRDIRREEEEIAHRLGHSTELVTKIRMQEAELFRQLLSTRLEPEPRAALLGEIAKAEADAATALSWHQSDLEVAATEIAKLDGALAKTAEARATLQAKAAGRDAELIEMISKARPLLGRDAT